MGVERGSGSEFFIHPLNQLTTTSRKHEVFSAKNGANNIPQPETRVWGPIHGGQPFEGTRAGRITTNRRLIISHHHHDQPCKGVRLPQGVTGWGGVLGGVWSHPVRWSSRAPLTFLPKFGTPNCDWWAYFSCQ